MAGGMAKFVISRIVNLVLIFQDENPFVEFTFNPLERRFGDYFIGLPVTQ